MARWMTLDGITVELEGRGGSGGLAISVAKPALY